MASVCEVQDRGGHGYRGTQIGAFSPTKDGQELTPA